MAMASKSEVSYSRGHAGAHCGKALDDDKAYCRYFIPPLLTAIRRPMLDVRRVQPYTAKPPAHESKAAAIVRLIHN
jgi:hypothetical protein